VLLVGHADSRRRLLFEIGVDGARSFVVALLLLAVRLLGNVERVVLVGSQTAADVVNLFVGFANNGIEDGIVAYGRGSALGTNDVLNVYGRPLISDTFTVTDSSFSTGSVTGLRRGGGNPANNAIILSVTGRDIDVNGTDIFSTGFETTRLVTLGGNDTIIDPDLLALVETLWNPQNDD